MSNVSVQFRLKRRTAAEWATAATLAQGEPGFETDTGRLKIGTGTATWANLPYVSNVRTGTAAELASVVLGVGELGFATDTFTMKVGNMSNTFGALDALSNGTSATAAAASATAAAASATNAGNAVAAAVVGGATTYATIATGTSGTALNGFFWVRPTATVPRFALYQNSSGVGTLIGSVAGGTEFDNARNDYPRVGGNVITNSTFGLEQADNGVTGGTPTGWSWIVVTGGASTIVTRPNTAIDSKNALQYSFNGANNTFIIVPIIQIPTHLRTTGSTLRFIYSIQLDSVAATAQTTTIGLGGSIIATGQYLDIPSITITGASSSGGSITYTCSAPFPLLASGASINVTGLPTTTGGGNTVSGASLNVGGALTAVNVAGNNFTITNATVGTFSGSANAAISQTGGAITTVQTITGISGSWQTVIIDHTVPVGWTSMRPWVRLNMAAASNPTCQVWLTGFCAVFNRQTLLTYDKNINEQITATATAATAAATTSFEQLSSPWTIGTNIVLNSLFAEPTTGGDNVNPTGYSWASGGGTEAPRSLVNDSPLTPFNTTRALRMTHSNSGTPTDGQITISVNVPTELRNRVYSIRVVYYAYVQDVRIVNTLYSQGITPSKLSVDGPINTWFPVVHNITYPAVADTTRSFSLRQQGGVTSGSWAGSPASAYSYITGVCIGFNRTNTTYDRNLASEITTIANASSLTARNAMNSADQYMDANGFMSPVVPNETIVAWGDSLTAAGWINTLPTNVITSFASASITRTGVNNGIGGETSTQILNRINGYSLLSPGGTTGTSEVTLRARRTQPPRLTDETYRTSWTSLGLTVAEPQFVNFYNSGTLIGTSYASTSDRLTAVSSVTTGSTTITANSHPFRVSDIVYFLTITSSSGTTTPSLNTNIYTSKHYFVREITANTYTISEFSTGTDRTSFSFTGTVTALGDFTLRWTPSVSVDYTAITTRTYTNRDTSTTVLWLGANNIADTTTVINNIASAVGHLKTLGKRVIVLTPIIGIGSLSDVPNRKTVGDWILRTYPKTSIDIWSVLRANGDNSGGDNADIAAGGTPRSLRADDIHLNNTGYGIVATQVYNFLRTANW